MDCDRCTTVRTVQRNECLTIGTSISKGLPPPSWLVIKTQEEKKKENNMHE